MLRTAFWEENGPPAMLVYFPKFDDVKVLTGVP